VEALILLTSLPVIKQREGKGGFGKGAVGFMVMRLIWLLSAD
jgi:hypothetical protein